MNDLTEHVAHDPRLSKRRTDGAGTPFALARGMPYTTNDDLPQSVRTHLPPHAQDIYRAAFNHAHDHYPAADEGRIHRIAWAAVKRVYEKIAGQWVRREPWDRHP